MNKVSIIIPVYNVVAYLEACIDSLLCQTWPYLEIILIDDGSSDGSEQICDQYATQDCRVRVIHQANAGAANAKNAGLNVAKGDYITFMDSDDWAEPDWIEKMVHAAVANDTDVVECDFWMDYVNSVESGNPPETFCETMFETQEYLRHYPKQWSCALFWNKLFRAELLKNIRFHTERRCIDDEFFTYKAISGANQVLRIPEVLYHYRQRCSSVTQSEKALYQRTKDAIDILAERYRWIHEKYPVISIDYLIHDVDTLLFIALNYPFDSNGVNSFRKASLFYLGQCLLRWPGKLTFYYSLKNMLITEKKLLSNPIPKNKTEIRKKYFP